MKDRLASTLGSELKGSLRNDFIRIFDRYRNWGLEFVDDSYAAEATVHY